jgi:hypothetical protein
VPEFTLNTKPIKHDLCGDFKYRLEVEDEEPPVSCVSGDPVCYNPEDSDPKVKVETNDPTDGGERKYKVIACLEDYCNLPDDVNEVPDVESPDGIITINSPCSMGEGRITGNNQNPTEPPFTFYTSPLVSTLVPFTVTPDYCEIETTCDKVLNEDGTVATEISCDDLECDEEGNCTYTPCLPCYKDGTGPPPKKYYPQVKACIKEFNTEVSNQCATVPTTIDLRDPCNTPNVAKISSPNPDDRTYTITNDKAEDFDFPAFSITPDTCEIEVNCEITKFLNVDGFSNSAITLDGTTSSFSYTDDIKTILDQF